MGTPIENILLRYSTKGRWSAGKPDVVKLVSEEGAKLQAISERLLEFKDFVTVERFLGKETSENMDDQDWEKLADTDFYDQLEAFQNTLEDASETTDTLALLLERTVSLMKKLADEE